MYYLATIVVVNFNSGDRLARCVEALAAQGDRRFRVIVVDNASNDGSLDRVKALECYSQLDLEFLLLDKNVGFAKANNIAAAMVRTEWICLLNPDAYPRPDWFRELASAVERYPDVDSFGSTQISFTNPGMLDGMGDVMHACGQIYRGGQGGAIGDFVIEDRSCFSVCAAACLYRLSSWKKLGGFDVRFFCYMEDVDFGYRLRLTGGRSIQVASAVVEHEGSAITGRESTFTIYHGHRNRVWMLYKSTPRRLYWPLFFFRLLADGYFALRMRNSRLRKAYLIALKDGYFGLGKFRSDRHKILRSRRLPVSQLLVWLEWDPRSLSRRRPKLYPIDRPVSPK